MAIALNTALVMLGRGSFPHILGVLWLTTYVAVPATLVGLVAMALGMFGPRAKAALTVGLMAGSTLASLPVGALLLKHDIQVAQRYCESLVPGLEAYKVKHGRYPDDIGQLGDVPTPPRLLRDWAFYDSDGTDYGFSFIDPSGMLNGYAYNRKTGVWQQWD